jgi:hypothetical protein
VGRGEGGSSTASLNKIPPHPNPPPQGGREYVIIVHTLDHAITALQAAHELHSPITLQTAPDAISYAGSAYLLAMFAQARQACPHAHARFVLDCNTTVAPAIAAIQSGHQHIRSCAPPEIQAKLADIAAQYGARMLSPPHEALDLQNVADTKGACIQWLKRTS